MIPEKSKNKMVVCIECGFSGFEVEVIREQWFPDDGLPLDHEYNDICPICKMASIVDKDD